MKCWRKEVRMKSKKGWVVVRMGPCWQQVVPFNDWVTISSILDTKKQAEREISASKTGKLGRRNDVFYDVRQAVEVEGRIYTAPRNKKE